MPKKSKRYIETYDHSIESVIDKLLEIRSLNIIGYEVTEDCVVFEIGEMLDTVPDKTIRRADALQYWLQQSGMPSRGSDTWSHLSMADKVAISQIEKALDSGGTQFSNLFEQAFGRNTEGTDVSGGADGFEVDFGVSKNTKHEDE